MAFAFWRCCAEFSMKPKEMMDLPIHLFWSMCRNLDRIRAEKDLRALNIFLSASAAVQGDNSMLKEVKRSLLNSIGVTVKIKEEITSKDDILKIMKEGL